MKLRLRLVAALLLGTVAMLVPLAYAAPPDPTWIDGVWDDADQDDVVSLITSHAGTTAPVLAHEGAIPVVAAILPQHDEGAAQLRARSSPPTRAPPLS